MRSLLHRAFRKFPNAPLEESLKGCFKDALLGASTKRLVIPSYNLGEDDTVTGQNLAAGFITVATVAPPTTGTKAHLLRIRAGNLHQAHLLCIRETYGTTDLVSEAIGN